MKLTIALTLSVFLVGCSSFTSPARKHELDSTKSYWIDYDATRRGTIVSNASSTWKSCAEPSPDAAIGVVAKLEGSLKIADQGEVGGKAELAQSIVNLAEKTQMVMFLRESLFRLCELSINSDISADKTIASYKLVIDAALALVEKERAEIDLAQQRLASADNAQFIYRYLSEKDVDSDVVQGLLKALAE
jgi:hypothetical protein